MLNVSATRLAGGLQPIVELLMGTAVAIVIIYGGSQAIAGKLLLGSLVGFVLYTQRFFDPHPRFKRLVHRVAARDGWRPAHL